MADCEVLVIGAGIAGASAAYALAERRRVVLLEREDQPGYHSTGRSAAMYLESYGPMAVRLLVRASGTFLRSPPPGFAEHPLLSRRGVLIFGRADQMAAIDEAETIARQAGSAIVRLDEAGAREVAPVLRPGKVAAALHEAGASDIDVHALHQGFLRGLKARGGRLVTGAEVTALGRERGLWRAETRAGAFTAPKVVNASGAWADVVAGMADVRPIGLVPKRRTALTFDPPAGLDLARIPLCTDVQEEFYFKPEGGRIMLSLADETPSDPCDAQPEELDLAIAIDRLQTATTLEVRRIQRRWAGLRSFVDDHVPVVGPAADEPSFLWLAGQGGYGIESSPAIAQCIAALEAGEDLPAAIRAEGLTADRILPARLVRAAA